MPEIENSTAYESEEQARPLDSEVAAALQI